MFDLLLTCWQLGLSLLFFVCYFTSVQATCVSDFFLLVPTSTCSLANRFPAGLPKPFFLFPCHHHIRTALHNHLLIFTLMTNHLICSPSFLFFPAFPPSVANPSDVLRAPACSGRAHTQTHTYAARCVVASYDLAVTNPRRACLINQTSAAAASANQSGR